MASANGTATIVHLVAALLYIAFIVVIVYLVLRLRRNLRQSPAAAETEATVHVDISANYSQLQDVGNSGARGR